MFLLFQVLQIRINTVDSDNYSESFLVYPTETSYQVPEMVPVETLFIELVPMSSDETIIGHMSDEFVLVPSIGA